MLTYQQKRSLYESIMQQIAPVVKSSIEQFCSQDDCQMFVKEQKQLDTEFEKIYKHFNETVSHLIQEEIDHMCVDYAESYQTCCSTFPKTTIQEMFSAYTDEKKRHLGHQPATLKTSRLGSESSNARRTGSGDLPK